MSIFTVVSCIYEKQEEFELVPGDEIPDFSVEMADGSIVTSEQLSSGPSLIMFFHTSCPDCRNTLPSVQKLYDEYKDKITFLLMSREQSRSEIEEYWIEAGYNLPFSPQTGREVYNLFATSRVPRVYICDKGVILKAYHDDPIPEYEELLKAVETIL